MKSLSLLLGVAALLTVSPALAAPRVPEVAARIALADGKWDILTVDPATHQVLIGRGDGVDAVDTGTGKVTPRLVKGAGFHSVAVVPGTHRAVATEAAGTAIVFDTATGTVAGEVKTDPDADASIYEPGRRTVWVMNGDSGTITIVDPVAVRSIGRVVVGGSLEFPAMDGRGHLFVNVEDRNQLVEIDIARRAVVRRTALAGCEKPTGLAYLSSGVLISACANGVAKLTRATDGSALGEIVIGPRPDGAFVDEGRHRAFIPSGGDGTLAVIDTSGPLPRKIATVSTEIGARTGAVDPTTGTVYLPAAKFGPPPGGGGRPALIPGSVELLVVR